MDSANENNEGRKTPPKDDAPPEQSRQPTQQERDAEAKRRATAGRARAPASAPGAVQSSHPAGGKGARARSTASDDVSNGPSTSAAASRAAVERNMEDRDALAKRRAAARTSNGPAVTPGVVAERNPPPAPAPAPAVSDPEPSTTSKEEDEQPGVAAVVAAAPPAAAAAPVAVVSANRGASASVVPDHAEAPQNVAIAAGAEEGFEDVEKPLDDYDESQKEAAVDLGPEAAVTHALEGDVEMTEAPVVYPGADPNMHDGVAVDGIEAFVADTVVDATGVAVVMSEEEEEQFEQKRRKKYLCYGAIVLVIVAVSIVVPVVLLVGGGGPKIVELPPSVAPSGAPSAVPSSAPTTNRFNMLLDYLETLPITPAGLFEDRSAPQYQAALWLADDDSFLTDNDLEFSDPKALQRYAVATFYYATGGNNWKLCGKNSPSCGDVAWLDSSDECTWFSIDCGEDGSDFITQINFPATGNDLIGEMPPEMSLLTNLRRFLAPENSLKGDLDVAFAQLTGLQTIAMPDNRLEGTIPTGILVSNPDLGFLDLGGNQFKGSLPSEIAGATKLSDLQLDTNGLTGTIPTEIGNLSLLAHFEIQTNELVGTIPNELYSLTKLTTLSIRENEGVNGTISPSISQLTALGVLQLGFTGLGGAIPEEMFVLTDLSEMNLEGAAFSGTIPESFKRLNASLMDLFLNDNEFTGSVPVAFDFLTALETLQIQGNHLTGSISAAVCAERGLRFQQLATLIVDCVVECTCCDNCEE